MLDSNERRHELGPRGSLLVVADGMGDAMAGEVPSQMATDVFVERLAGEADEGLDRFAVHLRAVVAANTRIHARAREWPKLEGMGTTAAVVGILSSSIVITQVGDSRAHRVRNGTAAQLTRDQSVMQHSSIRAGSQMSRPVR